MILQLLKSNRSCRIFDEYAEVPIAILRESIVNARFTASAANLQPLRYIIVTNKEVTHEVFKSIKFAQHLKKWTGPKLGERPNSYIAIVSKCDYKLNNDALWCDIGIAAQTICLSLTQSGYGCCMVASFNKDKMNTLLDVDDDFRTMLLIAVGKSNEKIVLVDISKDESTKYYRDDKNVHYVPKIKADDIILKEI